MTATRTSRLRLAARLLGLLAALVLVGALAAGAWFYTRLRASQPQLDGPVRLAGLAAPATVERDALGVPTIRGQNRLDAFRTLGWLHAQERFFQMDLLRRHAAGEVAELIGPAAVAHDRRFRLHGFRALAQKVLAALPPADRALLDAYTAGINAGLAALGEQPFEYLVLRSPPRPWLPEDSVLVIYALVLDLQDNDARYDRALLTVRDQLGTEALAFFAPYLTPDDAALDGSTGALPPIPGPTVLDLRKRPKSTVALPPHAVRDPSALGSNAFALSGQHTATGAALLASDPHLDLGVPNIWFRAVLEWREPAGQPRRLVGATLPGLPALVIGSNGQIAWGLTVAYTDTTDLIVLQTDPAAPSLYTAPGHKDLLKLETRHETLRVRGAEPVAVDYAWSIWGPVVATSDPKRTFVQRWTAHDPAAVNLGFLGLADAPDVTTAVTIARRAGVPPLNFVVADAAGDIAWTVAGAHPKRVGYDGRLPTNWTFGDRRWDGFLGDATPAIVKPPSGRLWSANHRMVGGEGLAALGDGGYYRAARAAQIRDDLAALERATPRDLLAIQLDDRARFLTPWQQRLLATLTPSATAEKKPRAELRRLVETWNARASVDSVGYRLVQEFRLAVAARVFTPIFETCVDADPKFSWRRFSYEAPLQALLREKPAHLLAPAYATWDDLLLAAADDVIASVTRTSPLPEATWGAKNTLRLRHPLVGALPGWIPEFVTAWLRFPATALPGDADMPRVQNTSHGASLRLVVSPGRENEGLFHMPGGQSGHPLSPYFRAGHDAWVRGEPTPLLPGPTVHTLTFAP